VPPNVPGLVMAVLSEVPELVGFFSYSREDDTDSFGRLSALRGRIQAELRGQLGRTPKTFRLWQDKEAIPSGTLWESEIKNAVSQAVFFIPIITPTVIASRYCRFELEAFLEREVSLGRDDLIFPILYIDVPALLEGGIEFESDRVLSLIGRRQYVDWREFRYLEVDSTEVRREVGRFCTDIRNALRRRWLTPEEFKQQEDAAIRQREEAAARQKEEAAARRKEEAAARRKEEAAARRREDAAARQKEEEESVRQDEQAERVRQEAAKRRTQDEARQRAAEQQGNREEVAGQSLVPALEGGRGQQPRSAEAAQQDSFAAVKPPEQKGLGPTKSRIKLLAIGAAAALILLVAVVVWFTTSSSTPPNPQLASGNSADSASKKTPVDNAANKTPVDSGANNTAVDKNVPADGLTQQEIDACVNRNNKFSLEDQINGCTESIRSGRWKGKNLAWAYGNRCISHKDKAEYDMAMRDCNEAITLDSQNAHAFNTRGAIYHLTEKYDQAIAEYSTAMKLDPKFIDPVHNRGMSYAAKGDLERAIDDYNAALRIDPRDALALYERGMAKQNSGDKNGGNADIAAARKIDPQIGN